MVKHLDTAGWYVATLHDLVGHEKTAVILGQSAGDRTKCIICMFDRGLVTKQDVIDQLGIDDGGEVR